jgi:hypothetical protein
MKTEETECNPDVRPQYLFLMRHADQRQGHLTKDGSAHVRSLAERLSEWMQSEWQCQSERRVRLWYTTQATEVQETADLLTREVLACMQRHCARPRSPFDGAGTQEESAVATGAVNHRSAWMATLPYLTANGGRPTNSARKQHDLERVLSAYSPDRAMFERLSSWLASTETGPKCARRDKCDSPLLVGNDPLIGWLVQSCLVVPLQWLEGNSSALCEKQTVPTKAGGCCGPSRRTVRRRRRLSGPRSNRK